MSMRSTILFLAATPVDTAEVMVTREIQAIRRALSEAELDRCLELSFEFEVRANRLPGLLLRRRPAVVHFSGHGHGERGLVFHGPDGGHSVAGPEQLAEIFRLHDSRVKCVVLNACYSEPQARELINHVDVVVGMRAEIRDIEALSFSEGFYEMLGHGCDIQRAFETAKVCLALDHPEDAGDPVLLAAPGVDPKQVFVCESEVGPLAGEVRVVLKIVFSCEHAEFDERERERVQTMLRLFTRDERLTVEREMTGSIIWEVRVAKSGADRLQRMQRSGRLGRLLGLRVSSLEVLSERPAREQRAPSGQPTEDYVLLERWVAGDRRAGDRLVKRYYMQIARYFMNAVGDNERRELTQETFSQLCTAISQYSGEASFRSYLFGIARNVLYQHLRRQYRRREFETDFDPSAHSVVDAGQTTPSRLISELVRREVLLQCLRELPVEAKQMLELYYWHGLTADELGVTYGIPAATVRTRLFNVRRKLKADIQERDPQLGSVDIEQQLETLRRLLGFGPVKMDEADAGQTGKISNENEKS
jgi:RNA polymerase sigma factor (sigma-70 family)